MNISKIKSLNEQIWYLRVLECEKLALLLEDDLIEELK
jgi:hypothetical protein